MQKIFFTFFILFSHFTFSQEEVDLSLQLEEKNAYPQKITSVVRSKTTQNGQVFETSTRLKTDLLFSVQKKENGIFQTQATYTDAQLEATLKVNGKENIFAENNKPLIAQAMKNLVNQPFSLHFSSKGKVTKVPVLNTIFEKSIKNLIKQNKKTAIPELQQKAVFDQLEQSFGAESLISNLETFMAIFPKNAVKIGDSWQISSFLSKGLNVKITTLYTLSEVTPSHLLIKGKALINLDNERITLNQGQTMLLSATGEITSEIKIDPKTKWVIWAEYSQQMKGENKTFADRSHQSLTMPFDSTSTISIDNQ